jgi:hypothetical protein
MVGLDTRYAGMATEERCTVVRHRVLDKVRIHAVNARPKQALGRER